MPNPETPLTPTREPRRYGAISALALSFFSAEFYRDVARRWRGIGFWYLFWLMFLTAIPVAVKSHIEFSRFARQEGRAMVSTFPSLTLNKGIASSDPDPCLWTEPGSGAVLLYVDTTGHFDVPKGQNAPARLSDKTLYLRKSATETTVYDLSKMPNLSVDKVALGRWLDSAARWIGPAIFGILIVFPLIWHLIQTLIYGLLGLAFCEMFHAKLDYGALVRLAVVALTPAMLVDAVLGATGVNVPFSGWLFLAMELGFLAFAVYANAAGQSPPPSGFPVVQAQRAAFYPPPAPGGRSSPPPLPPPQ